MEKGDTNKLPASDRRISLTHYVGDAVAKFDSDQMYLRRLIEKTALAMTADGTDDSLINLEDLDWPSTFMEAANDKEPLEDEQPFPPADEEYPKGSRDEDYEETGGDYTRRVRGLVDLVLLGDDDDLDAGEKSLPLECPPAYDHSPSAPPALDATLVKRHIMPSRTLGWVKGFITRHTQARTRQDHDYRKRIERTGATLSIWVPLGM